MIYQNLQQLIAVGTPTAYEIIMTEEKPKKKNYYEMEFCVKTDFGKITVLYDYKEAWNAFKFDFQQYAKSTLVGEQRFVDTASWQWCLSHAHETLKKIFPEVIFDALEQAYFEARARTINELHDAVCFERQEGIVNGKKISILNPIQPIKNYKSAEIKKFCKDVADKAYKDSRRRMKLNKRGGSKHKMGGIYYANLDQYYERFSSQAKSILKFYKWKKEQWENESRSNFGDEKWSKYFLEIMFQVRYPETKTLRDKKETTKNEKEKLKFEELEDAVLEILTIKGDEVERWKETFNRILAEDSNSQEAITFDVLTPETLAYHFLATVFDISAGTVENNLKELRLDKKRMLKQSN